MKKEFEKFKTSNLFEGILSLKAIIKANEEGIHNRKILKVFFDKEKIEKKHHELQFLQEKSKVMGFSIEYIDNETIREMAIGNSHGGILAEASDRTILPLDDSILPEVNGFHVMIDGIEDPYNFGYAIRTLYAAGMESLILTPRNWMGAAGVVCRASAGASELCKMYICDAFQAIEFFQKRQIKCVCADKNATTSIYDADFKKPLFLLVGGEKRGLSNRILNACDTTVKLEYGRDFKASLSAASAASVIGFEVYRQNRS